MRTIRLIDTDDSLCTQLREHGVMVSYCKPENYIATDMDILINSQNLPLVDTIKQPFGIVVLSGSLEGLCDYQLANTTNVFCSINSILKYCNDDSYNLLDDKLLTQVRNYAEFYLQYLSIHKKYEGFNYLAYLIAFMTLSGHNVKCDDFYRLMTSRFKRTSSSIERSMRYAIEAAWRSGDINAQYQMFGDSIDPSKAKPVVKELCAGIAERIRREMFPA